MNKAVAIAVLLVALVVGFFVAFPGPAQKVVFDVLFNVRVFYLKQVAGYSGKISPEAAAFTQLLGGVGSNPGGIDVPRLRSEMLAFGSLIPLASDITTEEVNASSSGRSVRATWFTPPEVDEHGRVVLYFHGGGFIGGSVFSHSGLTGELARRIKGRVLSVEYRLAPEHVLPAATEDALVAYKWLVREQNIPASKIVVAGDSAGGGLTLLTLLDIPVGDKGSLPIPAGGVTFSAWTDLVEPRASSERNKDTDAMVPSSEFMLEMAALAAGVKDKEARKAAKFSPIYAPLDRLARLPALFMSVGSAERLEDDTVHFAGKAKQAGVDVTYKSYPEMQHVFPLFFSYFPEADAGLNDAVKFIIKVTSGRR